MKKNGATVTTVVAKAAFLSLIFSLFVFSPLASAAIVVGDGTLADWGLASGAPGAYNVGNPQSQWAPGAGIQYIPEDQNPAVYALGPGYGGQNFDVEAIYFKREADIAYFAVVSGFPLAASSYLYGGRTYYPGDLAFDFAGGTSYEFGLAVTTHNGVLQGHLYENATWSNPTYTSSGPFRLTGGGDAGTAQFGYNATTYIANGHYFLEAGIPVSAFGTYWSGSGLVNPDFTVHWTMSCGNDALDLHVNAVQTPEPGTYGLLLMGLGAFGLFRRFRLHR
jgi:hypothetical protein